MADSEAGNEDDRRIGRNSCEVRIHASTQNDTRTHPDCQPRSPVSRRSCCLNNRQKPAPPPSYSPQRTSSLALRVGIRQINFTTSTASAKSFELMKIKRLPAITYVARCHAPVSFLHLCPTGKRPENTNPKRQQGTPPSEVLAPTQAARYRVGICRINFSTPTPSANSYGFADAVEKNAMIARLQ